MSIEWSLRAAGDLEAVVASLSEDGPAAAKQAASRIFQAVGQLDGSHGLGRPGRVPETRELALDGLPYVVVYLTVGRTVAILRILLARSMWP